MTNSKQTLDYLPALLLVGILCLGLLLRTIKLETIPLGLQADEASFLLNATALLETGRDEDGQQLPLYLHSLIDSKPALYAYLQVPFVALFGSTVTASRLPSALLGTLSIFLCYLLATKVFNSKWLGIVTAFFIAVSPWHIMNSRATQEVMLSFVFFIWNLLALYNLLEKPPEERSRSKQLLQWLSLAVSGILAMYSYHALKLVLVGFYGLLSIVALLRKSLKEKRKSIFLATGVICVVFALTASAALTRFSAIGLLQDDLPKAQIFELTTKTTGATPLLLVRAFYNKIVFYFHYWIQQYLAHFDLNFFFATGGATRRFAVPYHGVLYLLDAALIAFGGYILLMNKRYAHLRLPLLLLVLLAPLPASLTTEEIPSSIRSFTLILPVIFLMTIGVAGFFKLQLRPAFRWLLVISWSLLYLWSIGFFIQQLFVAMPVLNTQARSRHYEALATYLASPDVHSKSVTFTSDLREGYIYLWRAELVSLQNIQSQPLARYQQTYQLSSYVFEQRNCTAVENYTTELIVAPAGCSMRDKPVSLLQEIAFDDNSPGFMVFKNNKPPL